MSGSDGMREYDYVYEDRGRKVTMKFYILGDPQPKSLPAVVKSVKEEADKTRRTRTRLGFCVRCLKGILGFGDVVKEVRRFDLVVINIFNVSQDPPSYQSNHRIIIYHDRGM